VERIDVAREHLRMMVDLRGEDRGVREMRGQIAWYIRNMPGVARSRQILALAGTVSEIENTLLSMQIT